MAGEGKYKYLAKNIGLLSLSSFATKLIGFFLVPLYTSILSTAEYGIFDIMSTTINLLIPILTLNILEAALRFTMESNADLDCIVTTCFRYVLIGNIIFSAVLGLNHFFGIITIIDEFAVYFFLLFFSQSVVGVVTAYARGIGRVADLSISSVITSIVTVSLNIVFLLVLEWGVNGYLLANIIGPLSQGIYLLIRTDLFCHIKIRNAYKEKKKELLAYTRPLIANSVSWWVNNLSDRYVITFFLGLSANGVYSVASKIPSILNIFQTIFAQAWTLSAVKDFDPEDRSGFFSNTYSLYNAVMVIGCSGIILCDRIFASFLYAKDFYEAWKYVPWLTIAIVFGSLSGYLGGFFSAVKNSKIFARSTVWGAITNIVLNIVLTPLIGALGAAIATTVCYFMVFMIRLLHSRKIIRLHIKYARDFVCYSLLVVQAFVLLAVKSNVFMYITEIVLFVIIVCLYFNEVRNFTEGLINKVIKK